LRRVWLGSDNPTVRAVVDEAIPYVAGVPEFAAALVRAQPHIGLAPVLDEPFNRARSELHWLEYTLAGAATIASRTSEPGPYDAIRDGSDGLLASSPGQWLDALMRLASSSALREELVGRALERVLADYTVERRADEWADAYRWAADHAGRGRMAAESLSL
jgi:glycosyltransferase involved in cell wall biosynthesis